MAIQTALTWQVPYSSQLLSIPHYLYNEWVRKASSDINEETFTKREQSFLQNLAKGEKDLTKTVASQFDKNDEQYFADVENRIMSVLLAWKVLRGEKERYTQCKERNVTWEAGNDGFNWRALIAMLVIIPRKTQMGLSDAFDSIAPTDRKSPTNPHAKRAKKSSKPAKPSHQNSQKEDSQSDESEHNDSGQNEDDEESTGEEVDSQAESSEEDQKSRRKTQKKHLRKGRKADTGRKRSVQ